MSVAPPPRAARLASSHLRAVAPAPAREPADATPALVDRACDGDVAAWSRLYTLCYPAVYRQLRYYTGDGAVAEELAQEAFAQAMTSRDRFDRARNFRAWLHGIALNVVRKYWRRQRSTQAAHARLAAMARSSPLGPGPDDAHLQSERSRVLYAVLAELPERLREAFLVRELEGLAMKDASTLLGISEGNLAVRVCRARARIHDELRRLGWLPASEEGAP
jgi:RNA polymerase sigma factor (sigma-70 family)